MPISHIATLPRRKRARASQSEGQPDLFPELIPPPSSPPPPPPPRFARCLRAYSAVWENLLDPADDRPDFLRYVEDEALPLGISVRQRGGTRLLEKAARHTAAAFRHWQHLCLIAEQLPPVLHTPGISHSLAMFLYDEEVKKTEALVATEAAEAIKALNGLRGNCPRDWAVVLEPLYVALHGSKSVHIIRLQRGTYEGLAEKYPLFWGQVYAPEPWNDFDAHDIEELREMGYSDKQVSYLRHSPRTIWFDQMDLMGFNRTVRKLVPIKKKKRKDRLKSALWNVHWRDYFERLELLSPRRSARHLHAG